MSQQVLIPQQSAYADRPLKFLVEQEPWWKSLRRNIHDSMHPEKLPPLHLTSRPVKVRSIWGDYDYRKNGAWGTAIIHALMLAGIIVLPMIPAAPKVVEKEPEHVTLIAPPLSDYMPISPKKEDDISGGGGGGDRDKLQASKGKLPKLDMNPITPPAAVLRNEKPKLEVEPAVAIPENVAMPKVNLPTLGDPLARVSGPPSNGIGSSAGIGAGSGGGVGIGQGAGVGEGRGGGFGGGVFKVGGGVSAPVALETPDPEYSEEARKAKYQGTVVLWLIVGPDGRPRDMKVQRSLGMGLDQKAIEAVRKWRFEPAKKGGTPVAVQINVEVDFRLY